MNTLADPAVTATAALHDAIDAACARIAPTWPLDRFIAVNPYWGQRERPIAAAAAQLAALSGSPMLMPRAWYRAQWQAGRIALADLQAAIDAAAAPCSVADLLAGLDARPALPAQSAQSAQSARLPLATDLVDAQRDLSHAMAWGDYVTHHVSQCCAAFFDAGQATWGPDCSDGLYPSWRRQSAHDFGPSLLMGHAGFTERLAALPADPLALIAAATRALRVPVAAQEAYFTALLLSVNGWASWCAYRRWQARLAQQDDGQTVHLLAVRLAWEWLLHEGHPQAAVADGLAGAWAGAELAVARLQAAQSQDWLWQAALERSHQAGLCRAFAQPVTPPAGIALPAVQAVFCIDVRSEVFRRALEASSPAVQTLGFAGFFGLPLAYRPLGSELLRPQLPGLLAPGPCVTDVCDGEPGEAGEAVALGQLLATQRRRRLGWRQRWQAFRGGAGSGFSFVEACGLLYGAELLKAGLGRVAVPPVVEQTDLPQSSRQTLRPRFADASAPDLQARCAMAAGALRAMGLAGPEAGLARLVLLAGHGSHSANNPHAAGLDCGACGGQTGEVSARVLALMLNDPAVRDGLRALGIAIDDSTVFVAGLHDTGTDELSLFDTDLLPASHADDVAALRRWLRDAGDRARVERAPTLGLADGSDDAAGLLAALQARCADWAQTRPEWGLAGNASFIVAPRHRTRHINLGGRSFLHSYDWRRDPGFGVLELIMTAPMVVANWINLQYHASVVDPQRYGSGNKLLHNVVGGHLGVFEGNGGDLRIGLPLQSVHDGEDWRHTPLRLSVFIAAPQAAIDGIVAGHATVRQLVDHQWLHLFRLDDDGGVWRCLGAGCWVAESVTRQACPLPGVARQTPTLPVGHL